MKQFSKIVFASMMGTFMALGFLFFITIAMIAGIAGSKNSDWEPELGKTEDNSVLRLNFDGPLKDHVKKRDFMSSILKYDAPPVSGLFEITRVLEKAAGDSKIKGLLLEFKSFQSGMANAEALRREIVKFKKSGKFVMAYSEAYSEIAYMVASAADEVVIYPKGFFEWDGLSSQVRYIKNTMKKLDVVPQIFRVGKFKSAIEPYINEKMSEASREQLDAMLLGAWDQLLVYAAEKTTLGADELNTMAENMEVMYAKDALEKGFVNLSASFEEVEEKLTELSGSEDKPKYVNWRSYFKEMEQDKKDDDDNVVAVIFASGGIFTAARDGDSISSNELSKLIHKIRREEKVKAVVIRVNSPGGSALASDVIWTATQWLKDAKPVVTSFGNVAASGGYYMSAGSNYIFAEPTTITGSIGVFGLSFATKKFWNDNIGMTFDTAKSHRFADMGSVVRILDPEERMKIQSMVETIYEDFLNVVTGGRPALKTRDQTHELAQGRVWLGAKALQLGLVDEMGGVEQAIAKAAELAALTHYNVEVYPKELSAIQEFFKQFGDVSMVLVRNFIPESFLTLIKQKKTKWYDQIYTRLPYDLEIQ